MAAVADSSPLIYLAALSDFAFLIPAAVYREVVEQGQGFPAKREVEALMGDWLMVRPIEDHARAQSIGAEGRLHAGESEAIVLAQECRSAQLLMDDRRAVRCARSIGIRVTRTPVIYAEAKLRGWDPERKRKTGCDEKTGIPAQGQRLPVGPGEAG